MKAVHILLAAEVAAACLILPAMAQVHSGQCIVAGRVSGGQWAPKFSGVQLIGANGQAVAGAGKDALVGVKQVRLAQPALLSRCDGNNALANADHDAPVKKAPAPALSAGVVDVEGVAFPKLRTGGELVELRVRAPAERIVTVSR